MAWPDRPRLEAHDVVFEVAGLTVREKWLMASESFDEADAGAFMQNRANRLKEQSLFLVPEFTVDDTTSGDAEESGEVTCQNEADGPIPGLHGRAHERGREAVPDRREARAGRVRGPDGHHVLLPSCHGREEQIDGRAHSLVEEARLLPPGAGGHVP